MKIEKGGRWRCGLYWSWYDDWMTGVVRVPALGIGTLVLGPFRVVVMWPVYRIVEAPAEHQCIASQASIPA